jgi:hypothetical protein
MLRITGAPTASHGITHQQRHTGAWKPDWYWRLVECGIKEESMSRVIRFYIPDALKQRVKVERVAASSPAKVIRFRRAETKKPA